MDTLLRNGEYTLLGEEKLLDGTLRSGMGTVGGIALETGTVKRGDSALSRHVQLCEDAQ